MDVLDVELFRLLYNIAPNMLPHTRKVLVDIISTYRLTGNPQVEFRPKNRQTALDFLDYMYMPANDSFLWETEDDDPIRVYFFDAIMCEAPHNWDGTIWVRLSEAFRMILGGMNNGTLA